MVFQQGEQVRLWLGKNHDQAVDGKVYCYLEEDKVYVVYLHITGMFYEVNENKVYKRVVLAPTCLFEWTAIYMYGTINTHTISYT